MLPSDNEPNKKAENNGYYARINPYVFSFLFNNGALIIGHPADRLKVAVQIDLKQSQCKLLVTFMQGDFGKLYQGIFPSFLRQNSKLSYRTMILTTIPQWVDKNQLSIWGASLAKASLASVVDTLVTTPFENIKTRQMKTVEKISTFGTAKSIYNQHGFLGFFSGTNISIAKSYPSWFYLFLGYHATQNQREKQNFLYTIFYATLLSVPITAVTNPLDVIKSQVQAGLRPKDETIWGCAKDMFSKHGGFVFWRGFPFRLLHKSMMTAAGYAILDLTKQSRDDVSMR